MSVTTILITHIYVQRGVVAGWVEADDGVMHLVGHLPHLGWHCTEHGKRCKQIRHIKALVPVQAIEAGARGVEAGVIPAGACVPRPRRSPSPTARERKQSGGRK